MTGKFTWIPTYKAIARKLSQYKDRQPELIEVLKKIGITRFNDYNEDGSIKPLTEIDPFTFFSYLNKYNDKHRIAYLKRLHEEWHLECPEPSDVAGLPTSHPMKVWLFPYAKDRRPDDIPMLWELFGQTLDHTIQEDTLQRVLGINSVGKRKLSISWFYTDPEYYLPLDSQTSHYLRECAIQPIFSNIEEYKAIIKMAEERCGKLPYEISDYAWQIQQPPRKKTKKHRKRTITDTAAELMWNAVLPSIGLAAVSTMGSVPGEGDIADEQGPDMEIVGPITNVSDLMSYVFDESIMEDNGLMFYYRGQPDIHFELIPGIYRDPDALIRHEHIMFKEMESAVPDEFRSCKCTFDKLVKMQHYGLPTRLLDITKNPLVALYFACSDKATEKKEGCLFLFSIGGDNNPLVKYSDGDAVSVVSNISRRPESFDIQAIKYLDVETFNEQDPITYLLHEIRCSEKPHFHPVVNPLDIESVFFVKPKIDNPRIAKQEGAFFLFGINGSKLKCPYLPGVFGCKKFPVPANAKQTILKQLAALGITEASLFPDIDHIARNIKRNYTP